jgi:hypothetical protein
MKRTKTIITVTCVCMLLFSYGNVSGDIDHPGVSISDQTSSKSTQTDTKSKQTGSKPVQTNTKSTQTVTKPAQTKTKTTQTNSKSAETKSKSVQKSPKPETDNKSKDSGTVMIGTQKWVIANLNVTTFRNGDTIPEARTNKEWETAGKSEKPAWCYYNNNPANGPKFGRLYNWYAVNDPRGLAPVGCILSNDDDWARLIYYLGGSGWQKNEKHLRVD